MENPKSSDDHYISDEALQQFYLEQKFPDENFPARFKLDNNGSEQDFINKIDNLVDSSIFKQ
jgi:hypothetical protein